MIVSQCDLRFPVVFRPAMAELTHHKHFLKSLTSDQRAHLRKKDNSHGLRQLTLHLSVIVAIGFYIVLELPGWPLMMLPQGLALVFLFTLQHECTHRTPFRSVWINECVGVVVGLIIIQPFYWFRYFHREHHRFTNHPHRDPELIKSPKPESWQSLVIHVLTFRYWGSKISILCRHAFGEITDSYVPTGEIPKLKAEARFFLGVYLLIFVFIWAVTPMLLWAWLLPLVLGFPFLRLYLLAEHGRCPMVENMFQNTRTTFTNRFLRLMAWNMPYHAEHHVLPSVPFFRLPEFHEHTREFLQSTSNGYSEFTKDYIAGLHEESVGRKL